MNQRRGADAKSSNPASTLRSPLFLGLLLMAATVLAYQPVWQAGFIWDDDVYINQNRLLSAPDGRLGQRSEAREEFSEALRLKPNFPEADRELQKLGGIRIIKQ